MVAGKESRSARRSMASPSKRQRTQAVPLPPVEEDVCVAAIHGKCDDTVVSVVPVHVVWTAETSRLVRVGGGQVSVFNLTVTDGNDMVGVTLWRELAGKLSKRLPRRQGQKTEWQTASQKQLEQQNSKTTELQRGSRKAKEQKR